MSLTIEQARLVKGTIPALQEHGEHIATVFYKTMLKEHPDLNNYFNAVNMKNGTQPRALTRLILSFASNINHIGDLTTKLERVANKHASLGIQPDHYDIVCKYLIRAFAAVLGNAMTNEVRTAWTKAYWIMANMLTNRERQIYREFEAWSGWRRFIVDKKTPETEAGDVISLEMKPVDGAPLPSFFPGQYVSLRVRPPGTGYLQIRQYSLSDAPRPDRYRITVSKVKDSPDPCACEHELTNGVKKSPTLVSRSRNSSFSTAVESTTGDSWLGIKDWAKVRGVVSGLLVDDIEVGDVLELTHPIGDVYLNIKDNTTNTAPLVLISAGAGVSPMLSMLNTLVEADSKRPISWVEGAKQSIPFEQYVRNIASTRPEQIKTTFFKTGVSNNKDLAETPDSPGFGHYLEWFEPENMFFDNKSAEYYVCGPRRFMADISAYLVSYGVAHSQIRFELHSTGFFDLDESAPTSDVEQENGFP